LKFNKKKIENINASREISLKIEYHLPKSNISRMTTFTKDKAKIIHKINTQGIFFFFAFIFHITIHSPNTDSFAKNSKMKEIKKEKTGKQEKEKPPTLLA
jgi:hypothetical protein